jgi:UDP-glucose 4-epimerase
VTGSVHATTRRVLVTGGAGFVGVHLVRALAETGWEVLATARREPDDLTRAFVETVRERVDWRIGDTTDAPWLTRLIGAESLAAVVHAAAVTPTERVLREATRSVVDTNLGATLTVLEAVREAQVPRLLFASSTGVYAGAARYAPRREDEPLAHHSLYALCKLASEGLIDEYVRIHGLSAASVRIGSVYGPMERATQSRTGLSMIATLVDAALAGRQVTVSHPDIGRDFIHAVDVADAFVRLLDAPELSHRVYNLASPRSVTVRSVLDALHDLAGLPWVEAAVETADLALTAGHHRDPVDLSRLEGDTGFEPRVTLRAGLAHTLEWARLADDVAAAGRSGAGPA